MKKHLLLIGGGHAHMVTLANLEKIIEKDFVVTVIQPSEYHYYSGMGPGMLGGTYNADDIRFATRKRVEAKGGTFVLGKVYKIDPVKQCVYQEDSEEEIHYDVLSCNAGSFVPKSELVQQKAKNVFAAKPIEALLAAKDAILTLSKDKSITVAVIGSGPSSLEIAGNIHQLCRQQAVNKPAIRLFAGQRFMAGRPDKIRRLARVLLERKGVEIIEDGYVEKIQQGGLTLENGEVFQADIFFPAVGVKPSLIFARSGLPVGPDGGLQVNDYLQSIRYNNIFGGGDCIYLESSPLDKVGVYAVRQNPVLYANLMACLEGKPLEKFSPGGTYLLIYNLGDGDGIFSKWCFTFSGRIAFKIKDYIDRKFIRTFSEKT